MILISFIYFSPILIHSPFNYRFECLENRAKMLFFIGTGFVLIIASNKRQNKMTLVPIIYTSLMIFSALFFVVLLISYISYKAKTRGKLPKREADFIRFSPAPVVQPAYVRSNNQVRSLAQNQPVIRTAVSPVQKTAGPVQKKVYEQNINARNNVKVERSYTREQYLKAQKNNSQMQNTHGTEYPREKKQFQTRIEIMNESEKFRTTQTAYNPPAPKSKKNTGLNEMNILSYYSDSDNTQMVSLNATQVRQAI
jgi:hypothetical protein